MYAGEAGDEAVNVLDDPIILSYEAGHVELKGLCLSLGGSQQPRDQRNCRRERGGGVATL